MQIDDTRLIPPEPPFVRANTPLLCQRALMKEVERICSDMRFQDSKGNEDAKLVCYEQYMPLPHKVVDEIDDPRVDTIDFTAAEIEDALQRFPWCKTALVNISVKEPNGSTTGSTSGLRQIRSWRTSTTTRGSSPLSLSETPNGRITTVTFSRNST